MNLKAYGEKADGAVEQIKTKTLELESLLSVTDEKSEVFALNSGKTVSPSGDVYKIIKESAELSELTGGALDITIYPVLKAWGFTTQSYRIPSQTELDGLLKSVGTENISLGESELYLKNNAQIDLGATAKGYLADRTVEILGENKVSSALLNLGGTIVAHGEKPGGAEWKIGVADPENSSEYFGYLSLTDKIAATSGGYERYFVGDDGETYIHIIDPKTGRPVKNGITSVTVISDSGITCDALSTALFVSGTEKAEELWKKSDKSFEFIILTDDKNLFITEGAADGFKLAEGQNDIILNIIR